ncbi:MAG: heme exporter protein CcmB [Pseudomonadota bacterium]
MRTDPAAAGLTQSMLAIVRRELLLSLRRIGDLTTPLVFFAIICTLFPLALGPSRELLALIGPGIVWVAALLAQLLTASSIFRQDFEDGSLELYILAGHPLAALVVAKVLAYWLITGLPLTLVSPLLAVGYQLSGEAVWVLMVSLALGTLVLSLLGALGAALTLASRQGNALLSLLVVPLSLPVLIVGARAVALAATGGVAAAALKLLAAGALLGIVLAPLAIAPALRIAVD